MRSNSFQSVDDYIEAQPADVRPILHRLRTAIRKAVPEADEVISYRIPTYKLHGAAAICFAAWKSHYSLYPAGARLFAAFRDDLAPYRFAKATIRFPLSKPVPTALIARIAKFRAAELAGKRQRKATPKKG